MYSETTEFLRVTVEPNFIDNLSSKGEYNYIWVYNIVLENIGDKTVQLLNRFWHIIDHNGQIQKVEGPGVVGQQPLIKPGEAFEYSSHAQLSTSSGIMFGSYEMIYIETSEKFIVKIPTFSLDSPNQYTLLN